MNNFLWQEKKNYQTTRKLPIFPHSQKGSTVFIVWDKRDINVMHLFCSTWESRDDQAFRTTLDGQAKPHHLRRQHDHLVLCRVGWLHRNRLELPRTHSSQVLPHQVGTVAVLAQTLRCQARRVETPGRTQHHPLHQGQPYCPQGRRYQRPGHDRVPRNQHLNGAEAQDQDGEHHTTRTQSGNCHHCVREDNLKRLVQAFVLCHFTYVAAMYNWLHAECNILNALTRKVVKSALGLPVSFSTHNLLKFSIHNMLEEIAEAQERTQVAQLMTTKMGHHIMCHTTRDPRKLTPKSETLSRSLLFYEAHILTTTVAGAMHGQPPFSSPQK